MKAVCLALQKGGVGKTSLSGNLGHLASKTHKTLLIDADPQGSLSSWLITDPFRHELADVMQGKSVLKDTMMKLRERLWILPTFGIGGHLKAFAETNLEEFPFAFKDVLKDAATLGMETVIVDCSPGLGRLERMIMVAAGEVITPLSPEFFSLDGIEIFADFVRTTRERFREPLEHRRIVLNMVNRRFRRHGIYRSRMMDLGYEIFEIGQDSRIPEAQMMHLPLAEYEPRARTIPELQRLADVITGGNHGT